MLDSTDANNIDGSLSTIAKLCEDAASELDREQFGRPVNYMVPKLITFFGHGEVQIRKNALHSIVNLLQSSSCADDSGAGIFNAILANMDGFLQVCWPSMPLFCLSYFVYFGFRLLQRVVPFSLFG